MAEPILFCQMAFPGKEGLESRAFLKCESHDGLRIWWLLARKPGVSEFVSETCSRLTNCRERSAENRFSGSTSYFDPPDLRV